MSAIMINENKNAWQRLLPPTINTNAVKESLKKHSPGYLGASERYYGPSKSEVCVWLGGVSRVAWLI